MIICGFDTDDPYYKTEECRKEYIEILDDLFECNHDMIFIYKGEEMFLSKGKNEGILCGGFSSGREAGIRLSCSLRMMKRM